MAVLHARTREELRLAVGRNTGGLYQGVSQIATATGSTTTLVAAGLPGGDDSFNGWWVICTSGTNDGRWRYVDDYTGSTGTITIAAKPTALASTAASDTFELWRAEFNPAAIHDFINEAMIEVTGRYFDPEENISLHTHREVLRYAVPSDMLMINGLYVRDYVKSELIDDCDATWTTTTDADFTQVADDEDKRQGGASLRLTIAAGASANDVIGKDLSSAVDLSGMTHIELWIKVSVANAAGDLHILLDDTAGGGSAVETLSVPAVGTALTWTFHRIALANPELDTAIAHVRLRYTTDVGAVVVWLDDIRAVNADSSEWVQLPLNVWRGGEELREIM